MRSTIVGWLISMWSVRPEIPDQSLLSIPAPELLENTQTSDPTAAAPRKIPATRAIPIVALVRLDLAACDVTLGSAGIGQDYHRSGRGRRGLKTAGSGAVWHTR